MKITDYKDGKLITLSSAFGSRAKVLNLFYFIVAFTAGSAFLRMGLNDPSEIKGILFASILALLFYIVAYRFSNKAVQSERLFVNKDRIELINKQLFNQKKRVFDIAEVSNFRYLAKPQLTRHALSGESFDYLGFQTGQQVINELHGDNRLAFDYRGNTIKFGENIYSWELDELEVLLYDVTGRDLCRVEKKSEMDYLEPEDSADEKTGE
ncbi:MAG: hypothetical protein QM731_04475 [Chitinophagaceae bacterium]